MKIPLHQIAYQIGIHPREMAQWVYEGEVTGDVPDNNPQSKDAWVDVHSLRNFIQWRFEQGSFDDLFYQKAIRHIGKYMR